MSTAAPASCPSPVNGLHSQTRFGRAHMRVMLVPSALSAAPRQYLTTFLVGDSVAIDAGSLGFYGSPAEQARIRHVFLTHTHLDHIASLPIFLENVSNDGGDCPTIYAPAEVLDVVCRDVLNDRL